MQDKKTAEIYQYLKFENVLKTKSTVFITTAVKQGGSAKVFFKPLGKSGLNLLKLKNNNLKDLLRDSIFSRYNSMVSGSIMMLIPTTQYVLNNVAKLQFVINPRVTVLALKLNDKIYFCDVTKRVRNLNYKTQVFSSFLLQLPKATKKVLTLHYYLINR